MNPKRKFEGGRMSLLALAVAALMITWASAAIVGYVYYKLLGVSTAAHNIAADSLPGVMYSSEYQSRAKDSFRLLLEHIVTDNQAEMTAIEGRIKASTELTDAAEARYATLLNNPEQRILFQRCVDRRHAWWHARDRIIPISRVLDNHKAMQVFYDEAKPAFDAFVQATDELKQFEVKAGEQDSKAILDVVDAARTAAIASVVAAIIAAVVLVLLLRSVVLPTLAFILAN